MKQENAEQAADLFDELEKVIREEKPVRLTYVGFPKDVEKIKKMWDEGDICL